MTDDQLTTVIIVGGVIVLCSAIPYIIAASRGSGSATVQNSSRVSSVPTKFAPAAAFKVVVGFAQSSGYSVVSIDESNLSLCLEERASVMSHGFFIPINVLTVSKGGTVVEIGIKSKLYQVGPLVAPLVARTHEKYVSGIRAALFVAN